MSADAEEPPARPGPTGHGEGGVGEERGGKGGCPGAVPGGSPWRPGLAGCGCSSYSRRGTWIKGSSGIWQSQTTSSSSAPTGTGCSSPASTATVSSGDGARSHPLPLPPPPLSMAAAAPAARNSPGSAPLRGPHTRAGRNARRRGGGARPDGFAEARRGLARTRSLPFSRQSQGGRDRGTVRAAPPGGAFKRERAGLAAAAAALRPYRSFRPAPASGARAGGPPAAPSARPAPAASGAHVLGGAPSPAPRVRGALGGQRGGGATPRAAMGS